MTKSIRKLSRGYFHRSPRLFSRIRGENVNRVERGVSMLVGAGLVALGLRRHLLAKLSLTAAAGALIGRGITGRSRVYQALRLTSA